jgi:hypothetical protein
MSDCPGATIDSCRFESNSLNSGHSNGGALYVSANWDTDTGNDDPIAVTNSTFLDNSADGLTDAYGAAVRGSGPNPLQLAHNNFYNNWVNSPIMSGAVHSNDQLEINNSTFYGNTYSDVSGAAALDDEANCYAAWMVDTDLIVPVDTEGTGNIWNTVDPFVSGSLQTHELFLNQTSICVNAGRNAAADELWPGGWSAMTTDANWTPEGSTVVDTGVHYDPTRLYIVTFELEGLAYWELLVPDSTWSCFIYYVSMEDGLRSVQIPADQLSAGSMVGDFFDGAWLTCRSTAGDMVTTYGITGDLSSGGMPVND